MFRDKACFYGEELLGPRQTPRPEDLPLVGCPRLLIQYIRSYPPYRRTRHAMVTGTLFTMEGPVAGCYEQCN